MKPHRLFVLAAVLFSVPSYAMPDIFLFKDQAGCQECLTEILASTRIKPGKRYSCKGRFGDKPGNKYYVLLESVALSESDQTFRFKSNGRQETRKTRQEFILLKRRGLNETVVKNLCPDAYNGSFP